MIDEVRLEQRHIDEGVCMDYTRCALALAIAEHYDKECETDGEIISVYDEDSDEMTFHTSGRLCGWINNFDVKQGVHPITVCLNHDTGLAYIKGEHSNEHD